MYLNHKKARPEDLNGVLNCLKGKEKMSPHQIVKGSGLTLTAVHGAISELSANNVINIERQNKTPRMLVSLK